MADKLHIDIETYSSVDIRKAGHYKYMASEDFEILILCFALNDGPVHRIDMTLLDNKMEDYKNFQVFLGFYINPKIEKWAHNATFERNAFKRIGYERPILEWYCSAVKAAYSGFPFSLEAVSNAMGLGDKSKLASGKALIRYFSIPCKATKTNGGRTRNLPEHDPEKWEQYIEYCDMDVVAEREITDRLEPYKIPGFERQIYILDQEINDRGIAIDTAMAETALEIVDKNQEVLGGEIQRITGVDNPNSPAQLKKWLSNAMEKEIKSLAKDIIPILISETESAAVKKVLELRTKASKTSNKKYQAMLNCVGLDGRGRGFFQHYGANRTGRWSGRIVQLQNLPRNYIADLDLARTLYKEGDYEVISMFFDNVPDVLSQLIRTTFVAPKDKTFVVSDFSAIEARVIAWLANETWRLDVFNSHGKIYEASASMMFGIPMEEITKGSEWRQKGKVAELALGYQGSVGAVKQIPGGEDLGTDAEIKEMVDRWRAKSPNIVKLWRATENAAKRAIKTGKVVRLPKFKNLKFKYDGKFLTIELPSGRKLSYVKPRFGKNQFGGESIMYQGMNQTTKKWEWVDSYGGKFVENCVQAIARDILAVSMLRLDKEGFPIVMHVHDEAVAENDISTAEERLAEMEEIMSLPIDWAEGLPLAAEGYITPYYKKD